MIKCKNCSTVFEQKAYNNVFCSDNCAKEWWLIARRGHYGKSRKEGEPYKRIKVTVDRIETFLSEKYNDVMIIDRSTFINANTKARFIDSDYGVFWAEPRSVLYHGSGHPAKSENKQKATCLLRYGCEFPQQNKEIATKTARKQTSSFILTHWRAGEEIVCVGSFERLVIEYLNANKCNYLWQSRIFETPLIAPNGKNRTYRPDLYLENEQTWVEIKGRFYDDAKEKWEWFHSAYPNSELWDRAKLHALGIKTWRRTKSS